MNLVVLIKCLRIPRKNFSTPKNDFMNIRPEKALTVGAYFSPPSTLRSKSWTSVPGVENPKAERKTWTPQTAGGTNACTYVVNYSIFHTKAFYISACQYFPGPVWKKWYFLKNEQLHLSVLHVTMATTILCYWISFDLKPVLMQATYLCSFCWKYEKDLSIHSNRSSRRPLLSDHPS